MNKIFKYMALAMGVFFLGSCEEYLDEVPVTSISVDYIFDSPDGLDVGITSLYNLMRRNNFPAFGDNGGNPMKANLFFYVGTDLGHTRTWHRPYDISAMSPQGFPEYKWTRAYEIIDRASGIIAAASQMEGDEAQLNRIEAEAKAMRGECYFDLIRMYDNIILDTTAVTPQNANDPQVFEVANPADVYAVIKSDLDFAIEHLEWSVASGRYGQGAVRHIRGKVAMWESDWSEAASQFDAIIDDGTHYLVGLNEVFGQDVNHSESLFTYQRDEDLGTTAGNGDNTAGGRGTWHSSVFNNRAYEMSTGEIVQSAEYGGQALGWSFPNDYLQSLYDQDNDRRYTTYYYPLTKYVNAPGHPNFGEEISVYDDNFRRHHFSLKKFHDEDKAVLTNDSWKDDMYYRFAETLLLSAEAHWRMSGSDTDAKALEYINMIRERAFGNSDHNFTTFNLDIYLEESARELAFEKNRWFLLKRMGLLVERQQMYYTYGSSSTNQILEPMAPHMVRLPIPQSQIDLMGTFPQNPGY
ncbi:RagB/SusD family nutrient uptake outer membrane protein [Reichenbachiella ulvae]|uniref:RagB/SusD family nutrient uptake outer membrane protein n=1 Tax=Reichenbachiella ulvae TaxID=2980104 RepID=A0ABT3CV22_9BACT|nr:RagB/SusD family nutrient uptake outer membrane protein [Reichenbachiella ulvae]MCV9387421.1 RagB/SusD family nutrient uptake outer membrane protein [Reichenbachiella ulvae]